MEYMSQEGYDKLVEELRYLEQVELPRVKDAISEARDKGDLSENFEYHAAKREQARLLGRIRFKQRVLEFARVIDMSRLNSDGVGLLSRVEMTNLANNAKMTYTIASPHEANLRIIDAVVVFPFVPVIPMVVSVSAGFPKYSADIKARAFLVSSTLITVAPLISISSLTTTAAAPASTAD